MYTLPYVHNRYIGQIFERILNCFIHHLGAPKNRLSKRVLLSTNNICLVEK